MKDPYGHKRKKQPLKKNPEKKVLKISESTIF